MQTILEEYPTPTEARARKDVLRRQGIHAWMYHDFSGITSGAEGLERIRQTTTVVWYCTVDGLFDTP